MLNKKSNLWYVEKLIDAILYAVLIWVLIFFVTFGSAIVYDVSMQPTLNAISGATDNDLVYYNKLAHVDVGDIVVVQADENTMIIKRVIALAGDRVRYQYNEDEGIYQLYINNQLKIEDYTKQNITRADLVSHTNSVFYEDPTDVSGYNPMASLKIGQMDNFDDDGNYVVPDGQIFVMGDNRLMSVDSKTHGGYETSKIVGVVDLIIHHDQNPSWEVIKYLFS